MDDLFRMLVVRAPQATDSAATAPIPLGGPTQFQAELARIRLDQPHPQEPMWNLAAEFTRSPGFVLDVGALRLGTPLQAFHAALGKRPDPTDLGTLNNAVQSAFGQPPDQLVASDDFRQDAEALGDTIVAVMLAPAVALTALDGTCRRFACSRSSTASLAPIPGWRPTKPCRRHCRQRPCCRGRSSRSTGR